MRSNTELKKYPFVTLLLVMFATTVMADTPKSMNYDSYVPGAAVRKALPGICDFQYNYRSYQHLLGQDLAVMASELYGLDEAEAARIESLHQRHLSMASQGKDGAQYATLIDKRAQYFAEALLRAKKSGNDWDDVFLEDKSLLQLSAEIEAARPKNYFGLQEMQSAVEQMIGSERFQEARANSDERLVEAGKRINLRGLLIEAVENAGLDPEGFMDDLTDVRERTRDVRKMEAVVPEKSEKRSVPRVREAKRTPKHRSKMPDRSPKVAKVEKMAEEKKLPSKPEPTKRTKEPAKTPPAKKAVPAPIVPSAPPLTEWEQYVRDFIVQHELSESQTHSALGILDELQGRAKEVQARQASKRQKAESIKDRKVRASKLAEIDRPVDRLFLNLKTRLDQLLTAQQRAAAKSKSPAKKRN